jgi:hypothetical protein
MTISTMSKVMPGEVMTFNEQHQPRNQDSATHAHMVDTVDVGTSHVTVTFVASRCVTLPLTLPDNTIVHVLRYR